jgi:molybdate transport system substrate-binding protein
MSPSRAASFAAASLLVALASTIDARAATSAGRPGSGPLVAAAADLVFALEEIAAGFEADTGIAPRIAFGSSGVFARQIARGAPYEIFLSADEDYVAMLVAGGHARDAGELYALGRIVLFAPGDSPLVPDPALDGLARRLAAGEVGRFAIPNPEHAPYGRAAEQALRSRGLWEALQPHLVLGENAAQAAQFASGGDTEGGILPYSLALAPELGRRGRYALLPESMHAPLRQRMVLLEGATPAAQRFYAYLRSPAARGILARHGFVRPAR